MNITLDKHWCFPPVVYSMTCPLIVGLSHALPQGPNDTTWHRTGNIETDFS